MKMTLKNALRGLGLGLAVVAAAGTDTADACTRIVYSGNDSLYVVARSLDWKTPIPTNVYVYPRGIAKQSSDLPDAIKWTSKYGAVYAVGYDAGVTEGMNERGLSVNGLFCKGTVYTNSVNDKYAPMSLAMFPAWILDNCATTAEARDLLENTKFSLGGAKFDGGTTSTLHWEITDATGKSIILEYTAGDMNIYDVEVADYPCMTNDPTWPSMRAIIDYWEAKGGKNMLPGTVSSPDRCVRGTYFAKHVGKTADADLGATIALSCLNNCCVPYDYTLADLGEPNVSMTQWRSLSNLRDLRYYFNPVVSSGLWYVDLNKVNLSKGAPVLKIDVDKMNMAVGEQNHALHRAAPFTPAY